MVRWSPLGTYLATFHAKGIALWGGEKFQQIVRFSHPGVQFIDFSPCEKYLVSFSPLADSRATDEPQAIIIWDVLSGLKRRAFNADKSQALPIFKWSHDDKYFARMGVDMLSVYETPSFGLLDKKSIKVSNQILIVLFVVLKSIFTRFKEFVILPGAQPTTRLLIGWVKRKIPLRVLLFWSCQVATKCESRIYLVLPIAKCTGKSRETIYALRLTVMPN